MERIEKQKDKVAQLQKYRSEIMMIVSGEIDYIVGNIAELMPPEVGTEKTRVFAKHLKKQLNKEIFTYYVNEEKEVGVFINTAIQTAIQKTNYKTEEAELIQEFASEQLESIAACVNAVGTKAYAKNQIKKAEKLHGKSISESKAEEALGVIEEKKSKEVKEEVKEELGAKKEQETEGVKEDEEERTKVLGILSKKQLRVTDAMLESCTGSSVNDMRIKYANKIAEKINAHSEWNEENKNTVREAADNILVAATAAIGNIEMVLSREAPITALIPLKEYFEVIETYILSGKKEYRILEQAAKKKIKRLQNKGVRTGVAAVELVDTVIDNTGTSLKTFKTVVEDSQKVNKKPDAQASSNTIKEAEFAASFDVLEGVMKRQVDNFKKAKERLDSEGTEEVRLNLEGDIEDQTDELGPLSGQPIGISQGVMKLLLESKMNDERIKTLNKIGEKIKRHKADEETKETMRQVADDIITMGAATIASMEGEMPEQIPITALIPIKEFFEALEQYVLYGKKDLKILADKAKIKERRLRAKGHEFHCYPADKIADGLIEKMAAHIGKEIELSPDGAPGERVPVYIARKITERFDNYFKDQKKFSDQTRKEVGEIGRKVAAQVEDLIKESGDTDKLTENIAKLIDQSNNGGLDKKTIKILKRLAGAAILKTAKAIEKEDAQEAELEAALQREVEKQKEVSQDKKAQEQEKAIVSSAKEEKEKGIAGLYDQMQSAMQDCIMSGKEALQKEMGADTKREVNSFYSSITTIISDAARKVIKEQIAKNYRNNAITGGLLVQITDTTREHINRVKDTLLQRLNKKEGRKSQDQARIKRAIALSQEIDRIFYAPEKSFSVLLEDVVGGQEYDALWSVEYSQEEIPQEAKKDAEVSLEEFANAAPDTLHAIKAEQGQVQESQEEMQQSIEEKKKIMSDLNTYLKDIFIRSFIFSGVKRQMEGEDISLHKYESIEKIFESLNTDSLDLQNYEDLSTVEGIMEVLADLRTEVFANQLDPEIKYICEEAIFNQIEEEWQTLTDAYELALLIDNDIQEEGAVKIEQILMSDKLGAAEYNDGLVPMSDIEKRSILSMHNAGKQSEEIVEYVINQFHAGFPLRNVREVLYVIEEKKKEEQESKVKEEKEKKELQKQVEQEEDQEVIEVGPFSETIKERLLEIVNDEQFHERLSEFIAYQSISADGIAETFDEVKKLITIAQEEADEIELLEVEFEDIQSLAPEKTRYIKELNKKKKGLDYYINAVDFDFYIGAVYTLERQIEQAREGVKEMQDYFESAKEYKEHAVSTLSIMLTDGTLPILKFFDQGLHEKLEKYDIEKMTKQIDMLERHIKVILRKITLAEIEYQNIKLDDRLIEEME